jgi:hypothetical protein
MLIMLAATAILLRFGAGAAIGATSEPPPDLKLEQPFSLKAALKFGVIFLVLSVAGVLAQRSLGVFGPPGRVQSLNPRAWRTNRTFCSASSIQAMTDTSFVGCVLAIFGLGLGIGCKRQRKVGLKQRFQFLGSPYGTEIKVVRGFRLVLPGSTSMCKTRMRVEFALFAHPAIGQKHVFC